MLAPQPGEHLGHGDKALGLGVERQRARRHVPNVDVSLIIPAEYESPTQHSPNIRPPNASATVLERLTRNM